MNRFQLPFYLFHSCGDLLVKKKVVCFLIYYIFLILTTHTLYEDALIRVLRSIRLHLHVLLLKHLLADLFYDLLHVLQVIVSIGIAYHNIWACHIHVRGLKDLRTLCLEDIKYSNIVLLLNIDRCQRSLRNHRYNRVSLHWVGLLACSRILWWRPLASLFSTIIIISLVIILWFFLQSIYWLKPRIIHLLTLMLVYWSLESIIFRSSKVINDFKSFLSERHLRSCLVLF